MIIDLIQRLWCSLTGYRFQYLATVSYQINKRTVFTKTQRLQVRAVNYIGDFRAIKKAMFEGDDIGSFVREYGSEYANGTLYVDSLQYIGFCEWRP